MIIRLDDFNKYVAIAGFREAEIREVDLLLRSVRKRFGEITVQLFDAEYIASYWHLYFSALNALQASVNNSNISRNLAIETLLYASAQRQIRKAVEMLGVKLSSSKIAILLIGDTKKGVNLALKKIEGIISGKRDDEVLDLTDEKCESIKNLFGISELEIGAKMMGEGFEREALVELVIERVALLVIQR